MSGIHKTLFEVRCEYTRGEWKLLFNTGLRLKFNNPWKLKCKRCSATECSYRLQGKVMFLNPGWRPLEGTWDQTGSDIIPPLERTWDHRGSDIIHLPPVHPSSVFLFSFEFVLWNNNDCMQWVHVMANKRLCYRSIAKFGSWSLFFFPF